ncbi:DUF6086 family protein [Streptomyces diastatochromogenes]|nr:DUF6086 family protein [Streptomyces diastatochromogenes]
MSCFFLCDNQDVWNPSNTVARLFVSTAEEIQHEFSLPTGLSRIMDDECEVDGEVFSAFISSLLVRYDRSNNLPLRGLLEGVISIGLVLLDRAGRPVGDLQNLSEFWQERRDDFAQSMPRG